jgi:hypothetical protein
LRSWLRTTTAGSLFWKLVVFLVGALFIALGVVLIVLPGPLTIPPVLFGLWLWSTEFAWAERLRVRAAVRGRLALEAAKERPVHSAAATFFGVALLVAGVLAMRRYDIVDRLIGSFG